MSNPSKRVFYRTVIKVEVLSEEPFNYNDLSSVSRQIEEDCSGKVTDEVDNEEVDGPTMARLLMEQGSDPGFFRLTEEGGDDEDDSGEDEEDEEDEEDKDKSQCDT